MKLIKLGGLTFYPKPLEQGACFAIRRKGVQGLSSAPDIRRDDVARPGSHGSFALPGYYSARVVTLSGLILAPSLDLLHQMREQLSAVPGPGELARMDVHRESDVRWLEVQAGSVDAPVDDWWRSGGRFAAEFTAQYRAPLPWIYGETRRVDVGDIGSIETRGTQNSWPMIVAWGPRPAAWTIGIGGRELVIRHGLAQGQWLEIDTRTGLVRSNAVEGNYMMREVTGLMPYIRPGVIETVRFDSGRGIILETPTYLTA